MRGYELCLIIHPETSETDIDALLNDIGALISRHKGSVLKHEKWGKKNLKFTIKKQTKGCYCFLYFTAAPPVLREIDRLVRYNEAILRYAVLALDEHCSPEKLAQAPQPVGAEAPALAGENTAASADGQDVTDA